MDFMAMLPNIVGILETAMLIAGLFFMTCVIREKKHTPAHKALQRKASVCIIIFLALNVIRNHFL